MVGRRSEDDFSEGCRIAQLTKAVAMAVVELQLRTVSHVTWVSKCWAAEHKQYCIDYSYRLQTVPAMNTKERAAVTYA
jgi:hypothetical protein